MTLPEMSDLEGKCAVLERIAQSFPDGSAELDDTMREIEQLMERMRQRRS